MKKILILALAGKEGTESVGRLHACLAAAKDLQESGNTVRILFDGASVATLAELSNPNHSEYKLFSDLRSSVVGACDVCATLLKVKEKLQKNDIRVFGEYMGHPSLRKYIDEDYQIISY